MREGDVYYNCVIPEEETWEETLTRPDLKILQVGKSDMTNTIIQVNLMATIDNKLVTKVGSGTEEEIAKIIATLNN